MTRGRSDHTAAAVMRERRFNIAQAEACFYRMESAIDEARREQWASTMVLYLLRAVGAPL